MEYTEQQLRFIQEKRPEQKLEPVPTLDYVIVEFLKKYEVFVQPVTSKTKRTGENIATGTLMGAAGLDVGLDAAQLSGQNKQTQIQEWTQWKQWALDHKDFEAFRVEMIDKPKEKNKSVEEKLKDPNLQKELEPILEELEKHNQKEGMDNAFTWLLTLGVAVVVIVVPLVVMMSDDNSSFNPTNKTEKIKKYIS